MNTIGNYRLARKEKGLWPVKKKPAPDTEEKTEKTDKAEKTA